jgi:hypothetical protein
MAGRRSDRWKVEGREWSGGEGREGGKEERFEVKFDAEAAEFLIRKQ